MEITRSRFAHVRYRLPCSMFPLRRRCDLCRFLYLVYPSWAWPFLDANGKNIRCRLIATALSFARRDRAEAGLLRAWMFRRCHLLAFLVLVTMLLSTCHGRLHDDCFQRDAL